MKHLSMASFIMVLEGATVFVADRKFFNPGDLEY